MPGQMYEAPYWRGDAPDHAERSLKRRIAEIEANGGSVFRLLRELATLQEDRRRAAAHHAGSEIRKFKLPRRWR